MSFQPVRPSFIFGTQIKIFLMNSKSTDISGSTVILQSYEKRTQSILVSFVKLRLNHWCHMDYFNDVLTMFLDLDRVRILAVYGRVKELLGIHHQYLNLCSEDERRSYRFGTTWGWVINDRIFIFGWTINPHVCSLYAKPQTPGIPNICARSWACAVSCQFCLNKDVRTWLI